MKKMAECQNLNNHEDDNGLFAGHHDTCPGCGSANITNFMWPENPGDIAMNRDDYNRRNMHKPGFVPSVEYIVDPNDPTKTIPKPVDS